MMTHYGFRIGGEARESGVDDASLSNAAVEREEVEDAEAAGRALSMRGG